MPVCRMLFRALAAARRLASGLNGGQQERDENADDRDNDQQFDESERVRRSDSWQHLVIGDDFPEERRLR